MTALALAEAAAPFARVVGGNLAREYPYAAQHLQRGPDDPATPRGLHPAFGASFDWHSCVHMTWLATRLLERAGDALDAGVAADLERSLAGALTADHVRAEADYLRANPSFERPYGWAWAATLAASLDGARRPSLAALAAGVRPLADAVFDLTGAWLRTAGDPVRHGVHTNTAYGLRRVLLAARALGRDDVAADVAAWSLARFGSDTAWPFRVERSGHDFLSPGLAELDLLLVVLDDAPFAEWAASFTSELAATADPALLRPATVADEHDGHQTHLHGLGLSSAAVLTRFARRVDGLPSAPAPLRTLAGRARAAVPGLIAPGLAAAVGDEYASTHWLATFAWEALAERSAVSP